MPTDRKPRIAISPEALRALRVWAALEDMEPGDLVSKLVSDHMPARVRDVLGVKTPQPSEGCGTVKPHSATCATVNRPKKLSGNQDALQQIKTLWNAGERNRAEIARKIGYPKATTSAVIARMIKAGELAAEEEEK